jgi:hypothetical protein
VELFRENFLDKPLTTQDGLNKQNFKLFLQEVHNMNFQFVPVKSVPTRLPDEPEEETDFSHLSIIENDRYVNLFLPDSYLHGIV